MIRILFLTTLVLLANEEKLKENTQNALSNLKLWQENRDIAQKNVDAIAQALEQSRQQQKEWKSNYELVQKREKELNEWESKWQLQKKKEEELLKLEQQEYDKLTAHLQKLKESMEKRKANLEQFRQGWAELENQKKEVEKVRKEYEELRTKLVSQEKELVKEGNDWHQKKLESENQVKKWQKLYDYHAKIEKNYKRLANER